MLNMSEAKLQPRLSMANSNLHIYYNKNLGY